MDERITLPRARCRRNHRVQHVLVCLPRRDRRSRGHHIGRDRQERGELHPLLVVVTGERDPAVDPCGRVDAVRGVGRVAVSRARALPPRPQVLECSVANEREVRLLHGKVDVLSAAGALAVAEGGHDGCHRVQAGDGIRVHLARIEGRPVRVTQKRRHAGCWLDGPADTRHILPRAAVTVGREAAEDDPGIDRGHLFVTDAEVAEDSGREVFGNEVRVTQELPERRHPAIGLQVERHAPFVEVHGVVERVAVPGVPGCFDLPQASREWSVVAATPAIRALAHLHLDDVGAHEPEEFGAKRPGPGLGQHHAAVAHERPTTHG